VHHGVRPCGYLSVNPLEPRPPAFAGDIAVGVNGVEPLVHRGLPRLGNLARDVAMGLAVDLAEHPRYPHGNEMG
jgi:hypothetical protein